MKYLFIAITWLGSLSFSSALVHFKAMEKGTKGCLINGKDVAVGESVQDENSCGAYTCQNEEGDTFIHYCQIPATFAECPDSAVVTTLDFPACCWTCAAWGKCAGGGGSGDTGAAPATGDAAGAEGAGGAEGAEAAGGGEAAEGAGGAEAAGGAEGAGDAEAPPARHK